MLDWLVGLFDSSGFLPRWRCGEWSAALGWTHIVADAAVFGAYTAIPLVLWLVAWRRGDLPFPRVFWLFGAFIFCCGTGHLVEALIFWLPVYRLDAVVKVATALVSWATVAALIPVVPKALALPRLADVNASLAAEIARRESIEAELRERAALLERFDHVTMGRELRVVELKLEVDALLGRLGVPPKYGVSEPSHGLGPA